MSGILLDIMAKLFPKNRKPLEVQTILFRRDMWTLVKARAWLKEHGYSASKLDLTPHMYRFRQESPRRFVKGAFRTISFGGDETGIKAVVAYKPGKSA